MLWRIDTQTKGVARVPVDGGDLKNGDGVLLLTPHELLVVRNVDNEVLRLQLDSAWSSARVAQRLREPRFSYPTTAALSPYGLMVVNSQLDRQKVPPPLLPFDVLTLEFPR